MRLFDDLAVSELMGYTVLVAIVSIAAICLLTGGMGTLSAAEKRMEFAGSVGSLESFAGLASSAVETNNTFYAAQEMSVPAGSDLIVMDKHDDFRSIGIYAGDTQLAFLPMGSIRVQAPFRMATFESGAVISNDTGLDANERSPAIYTVKLATGRRALYMTVISLSSGSFVCHGGPVTLYVRCASSDPMAWHIPDGTSMSMRVSSGDLPAWKERLERCGFTVVYEDGAIKATSGEVSDVYVTYADVDVKRVD